MKFTIISNEVHSTEIQNVDFTKTSQKASGCHFRAFCVRVCQRLVNKRNLIYY